jgi:hypothetical protein
MVAIDNTHYCMTNTKLITVKAKEFWSSDTEQRWYFIPLPRDPSGIGLIRFILFVGINIVISLYEYARACHAWRSKKYPPRHIICLGHFKLTT